MNIKYCDFLSWQKIGDTVFVVNEKTRQMYYFDDIASDFWIQIGKSKNLNNMIDNIRNIYDISEGEVSSDIKDFLLYLKEEDIIKKKEKDENNIGENV